MRAEVSLTMSYIKNIVGIRTSVQITELNEKTTFKCLNIYQNSNHCYQPLRSFSKVGSVGKSDNYDFKYKSLTHMTLQSPLFPFS